MSARELKKTFEEAANGYATILKEWYLNNYKLIADKTQTKILNVNTRILTDELDGGSRVIVTIYTQLEFVDDPQAGGKFTWNTGDISIQ